MATLLLLSPYFSDLVVEGLGLDAMLDLVSLLVIPLTSCVTLGKLLKLSKRFLICEVGIILTPTSLTEGLIIRIN